jgi:hypothetical protein
MHGVFSRPVSIRVPVYRQRADLARTYNNQRLLRDIKNYHGVISCAAASDSYNTNQGG